MLHVLWFTYILSVHPHAPYPITISNKTFCVTLLSLHISFLPHDFLASLPSLPHSTPNSNYQFQVTQQFQITQQNNFKNDTLLRTQRSPDTI